MNEQNQIFFAIFILAFAIVAATIGFIFLYSVSSSYRDKPIIGDDVERYQLVARATVAICIAVIGGFLGTILLIVTLTRKPSMQIPIRKSLSRQNGENTQQKG